MNISVGVCFREQIFVFRLINKKHYPYIS